jgi:hypothetical protein
VTLLLDTHSFLWFVLNDSNLSAAARVLIIDPQNDILISPATYWEIAVKVNLRHEKGSLLVTTNQRVCDCGMVFADGVLAPAILDQSLRHGDTLMGQEWG